MCKRNRIRFISLVLILITILPGFSSSAEDLDDFTRWKQADPRWDSIAAGDQILSLTMLLRQYEIVTEEDFTPLQCREMLQRAEALDENGKLIWSAVQNAFPGLRFENRVEYSFRKVSSLYEYGHPCIIEMQRKDEKPRYAAVRSIAPYTVNIMDPGSEDTRLTQSSGAVSIYYFSLSSGSADIPEYAMFPAPVMEITQLAYESYSHVISNAIDIIPHGELIAPFRCTVTFTDPSWGYVVLQSTGKVLYADGTRDYMTVSYVHSEDIGELIRAQKENRIICQGEPIYHAGGMGRWNPNAFREHVHVAAYRGHVSGVTDDGYYGCGDVYPYDAFFINPEFTTKYHGRGEGYKSTDSFMYHKAPDDYRGKWKTAGKDLSLQVPESGEQSK